MMTTATATEVSAPVAERSTPWYLTRSGLWIARLSVGVAFVLLWAVAAHFMWLPRAILPTPVDVLREVVELAIDPGFWVALLLTLRSAMTALALGTIVGVFVGLVLGTLPPVERTTRFLMDLGRSFPVIALLPVMILILGVTTEMEVTVIFLAVVWPILLQTTYGSRRLDPVVRDTTRSYQISAWLRFFKVLLPTAAPFALTGVRVAAAVSILLAIAVELLGRTPGMGFNLGVAQVDGASDVAIAYVFYAGLLGLGLNTLLQFAEDKLIVWNARGDKAGES